MILPLLLAGAALAAPLGLDEVRAEATARSLEVQAAQARAEAARGDAVASLAGHLPAVTAFATGSVGSGRTAFGFDRPVGSQVGLGVQGSWSLVDPASWLGASAARRSAAGQEAMALWARVEARRAATVAFAQVLAAQDAVAAWSRALEDATRGAQAVAALVEAGVRPAAEGARARAEAAAVLARLRAAEGSEATACATLQGLVRASPREACDLAPPAWSELAAPAQPPASTHPALVAARAALDASQAERTGAWLERAPTVTASGTAAAYAADGAELGPGWSAGLDVELPVLTGGSSLGGIRGETARADVARAELDSQARDLEVALVGAEGRLRAALAAVQAQQAAVEASQAAFELVDQRFAAGLEPLQGWLDARRDRDAAAVALAEARRDQLAALADVEAARGVW